MTIIPMQTLLGHFALGFRVSEHVQCMPLGSSVASMQPLFLGLEGLLWISKGIGKQW